MTLMGELWGFYWENFWKKLTEEIDQSYKGIALYMISSWQQKNRGRHNISLHIVSRSINHNKHWVAVLQVI